MTAVIPVTVAVEGTTDVPVVRRVLSLAGCSIHVVHGLRGKHHLDRNLSGYNSAARYSPWFVLRDLDHDAVCAATLAAEQVSQPAAWMRFRISIRATESWLLADAESVSRFLRIKTSLVPIAPEDLDDPKSVLVNLAKRSPSAALREDIVPAAGTSARVGPGYTARISEFALNDWRPEVAINRSNSLERCVTRLKEFASYISADGTIVV